ncbi:MAG: XRE family transcriptional regulator [Clostridia bacterium]|nr:XRE family transcriptional regulator [Clostridia bacterium]
MNRIKELRIENRISQAKLSKKLKIAQNTLSYWENGKYEPDIESINKIAEIFHVSVDYLLGNTENPMTPNEKPRYFTSDEEKIIDLFQSASEKAQKAAVIVLELGQTKRAMQKHDSECAAELAADHSAPVRVPVIGRSAAGIPIEMIEDSGDPLEDDDPRIRPGDFAVIAAGDSMIDAGINDGDRVIIRPCPCVENGTIALVAVADGSTIKRFYKTDLGYKLVPANSAYNPMLYTPDAEIRILGRFIKVADPPGAF